MKRFLLLATTMLALVACNTPTPTPDGAIDAVWVELYTKLQSGGVNTKDLTILSTASSSGGWDYSNETKRGEVISVVHCLRNGVPEVHLLGYDEADNCNYLGCMLFRVPEQTTMEVDLGYGEKVATQFYSVEVNKLFITADCSQIYAVVRDVYLAERDNREIYYANMRLTIGDLAGGVEHTTAVESCEPFMLGWQGSVVCGEWCYSESLEPMYELAEQDSWGIRDWGESIIKWNIPIDYERCLFVRTSVMSSPRSVSQFSGRCWLEIQLQNFKTGETEMSRSEYLNDTEDKYDGGAYLGCEDGVHRFEVYGIHYNGERVTYPFEVECE